jgi:hypothetical protein
LCSGDCEGEDVAAEFDEVLREELEEDADVELCRCHTAAAG